MKLSRIDIIGLNGGDGLHYHELDILDRLESATKVNGAYPKDIADAITEIKMLRDRVQQAVDRIRNIMDVWSWDSTEFELWWESDGKYRCAEKADAEDAWEAALNRAIEVMLGGSVTDKLVKRYEENLPENFSKDST